MNNVRMNPNQYPDLPKWPLLAVEGEPVSPEDAAEIIIRTTNPLFHTNDRQWRKSVRDVLGLALVDDGWDEVAIESANAFCKRVKSLMSVRRGPSLYYLQNSMIASSYVGGPHGWCNWDGTIFTNSYNIGKWPSVIEVLSDWALLATTFPQLKLRSQLFSGEGCEDDIKPLVEFVVETGKASVVHPGPAITPDPSFKMAWNERGCDLDRLRWAYNLTVRRHEPPLVQLGRACDDDIC